MLLANLESVRHSLLRADDSAQVRLGEWAALTYRAMCLRLAKGFLVPPHRRSKLEWYSQFQIDNNWLEFEASRRVLELRPPRRRFISNEPTKIVCHLFALNTGSVEHLWPQFTDVVIGHQRSARLYDPPTESFMQCRPGRQVASRWYWEVVIAPRWLLLDANAADFDQYLAQPVRPHRKFRPLTTQALRGSIASDMDVEFGPDAGAWGEPPEIPEHAKVELDPSLSAQSNRDWAFILGEIDSAVERGHPLDDVLVQTIARRRYQLASEAYEYPDQPGAGATLDSSHRIVGNIVELYRLGQEVSSEIPEPPSSPPTG
jgi:hypothetical protein